MASRTLLLLPLVLHTFAAYSFCMLLYLQLRQYRLSRPSWAPLKTVPKSRHWDQRTTATGKECSQTRIEPDTGKMKIERFVSSWVVVAGVREITERDPRHEPASRGFEIELTPGYFSINERQRVIRTGHAGCTRNCRNTSGKEGRQKNRDSHAVNV